MLFYQIKAWACFKYFKQAAAKKRLEFKQTVGMLESKKAKLESENDSITTEVSQLKNRIAKMEAGNLRF